MVWGSDQVGDQVKNDTAGSANPLTLDAKAKPYGALGAAVGDLASPVGTTMTGSLHLLLAGHFLKIQKRQTEPAAWRFCSVGQLSLMSRPGSKLA